MIGDIKHLVHVPFGHVCIFFTPKMSKIDFKGQSFDVNKQSWFTECM